MLGTAPFAGGVASLLGDVAQKRQEIHLRRFLISLAEQVEDQSEKLRDKLDPEYIRTDEFAATVEAILQEAARTADGAKLEFLRHFFLFSSLQDRPDTTWRDLFLQYIRQLSGIHLVALSVFYRHQGGLPDSDLSTGVEITRKVPFSINEVARQIKGADPTLLTIACIDLCNLGLLVDWRALRDGYSGPLQEKYVISRSGKSFFCFLQGEWRSGR